MSNEAKKPPKSENAPVQGTSSSLRGWPGYRTREGRSGLDPYDNDAEAGHMAGVFFRRLLTGRLRIRNPFSLVLSAVLGLGCLTPFVLAILEATRGDLLPFGAWVLIAITGLFGTALLANVIRNIQRFRVK